MRSKSLAVALFAVAIVTASLSGSVLRAATPPADDSTDADKTELTFFAGISAPIKKESSGFGLEVKTGTPIGGRVSYNFTHHHAVEFSVANPFSASANYLNQDIVSRGKRRPLYTPGIA